MSNNKCGINCDTILLKEIDLIQSCIVRMANNSSYCKGWAMAIVVAVIGVSSAFNNHFMTSVCILSLFILWVMDSNYLFIERMYRRKYESTVLKRMSGNANKPFDLNPNNEIKLNESKYKEIAHIMISWSELIYPILMIVSTTIIFTYCKVI